ncbi:hypothetical protein F5Y07DRAFT_369888 [Xylaria sp. FL0933]|nr:hypothetical protein F5Y07DRAFT_369888 [Xylaria sp. FL0933]
MGDQSGNQDIASPEAKTVEDSYASDNKPKAKDISSLPNSDSVKLSNDGATNETSGLLEELRQIQKKLAEVDERTRQDLRATQQANLTMQIMSDAEEANSILSGRLLSNIPPPMSISAAERLKRDVFGKALSSPDNIELLRLYMGFSRRRLEHRQIEDRYMHSMFEQDLETYYEELTARKETNERKQTATMGKSSIQVRIDYAEWHAWKFRARRPENESCVVDVLLGEPILTDSYKYNGLNDKTTATQVDKEKQTSQEHTSTGEEQLPERIRINSRNLIHKLGLIHGGPICPPGSPLVMVRPFKFLTFYQNDVRQWKARTQEEIEASANDKPPSTHESSLSADEGTGIQGKENRSEPSLDRDTPGVKANKEALTHVSCLLEFLDNIISKRQSYIEQDCKKISFSELWYLFKPGTEVIEAGDKYMQCYRVVRVTSPKHRVANKYSWYFRSKGKVGTTVSIHCVSIDFDGSVIGPVSHRFDITRYEGLREIKSLPVYPLRLEDDREELRGRLILRGKKFLKVLQVGHMHYSGLTLESKDEIDSQVVIDFTEALATRDGDKNNNWKPKVQIQARVGDEKVKKDDDSDSDSDSDDEDADCDADCCLGERVYDDSFIDTKRSEQYLSDLLDNTEANAPAPLAVIGGSLQKGKEMHVTDDDLVIMSYRVFGFVLRSRSWAKLDVAQLMDLNEYREKREIEDPTGESKSGNAFDNLVFPKDGLDRKKIVRSLVAQHFRDKESSTGREEQLDIVRGKGKGLIILLHGAPGVGKTTTAEGIAELFNKPLFQITCGDLGTTAKEVEAALETNFSLANKWGSILLLDEADVFLARRTPHDFQRNGLVAVFLRILEYYAGILFLTTNRIGDFDEAFSSRIHISLHYPALDYDSTVDVFDLNWRLMKARFRNKGRALKIDESKIAASLADYWHRYPNARWNGRQIRNACQTALALAEFEAQTNGEDGSVTNPFAKVHLGVSHMKTVSDAYLEFIKYLQDVRDADQERYAFLMGIRRQEGKEMHPENPLAYGPSTPTHRAQVSRLAEHRAKSAARYNRPEQGFHPPGSPYYANVQGDRPSPHHGGSMGSGVSSPYQHFSQQASGAGTGPYQPPPPPPLEPQAQRGWNPGPVGGYYAGSQETQLQQGPSSGGEGFSGGHPYGQH